MYSKNSIGGGARLSPLYETQRRRQWATHSQRRELWRAAWMITLAGAVSGLVWVALG